MIAIIDYDASNIKSVEKAIQFLGKDVILTRDKEQILSAEKIILPGVGNFGVAMEKLAFFGLIDVIKKAVEQQIPILGICLGLQLLFESSEESPGIKGLGILKGKILKIPKNKKLKIPHIGWNVLKVKKKTKLFDEEKESDYVYFVHSYYLQAEDLSIVSATTEYGIEIHAAVEKGNVFACQFHPEKSSDVGIQILKKFIEL